MAREAITEEARRPDFGPDDPHPRLGATAVGARPPLVAINCVLVSRDVTVARRIARDMRERSGGLRGVRALGFFLPEYISAFPRPEFQLIQAHASGFPRRRY